MDQITADPRTYFAAERTLLAWIRTGLGLMGVGFAVARFGLFLRQLRADLPQGTAHATGLSVYSGVAIVILGVAVNAVAAVQHVHTVHELKTGTWIAGRASRSAVSLALVLAFTGLIMGAYLLFLH